jgi:hypothetical protein
MAKFSLLSIIFFALLSLTESATYRISLRKWYLKIAQGNNIIATSQKLVPSNGQYTINGQGSTTYTWNAVPTPSNLTTSVANTTLKDLATGSIAAQYFDLRKPYVSYWVLNSGSPVATCDALPIESVSPIVCTPTTSGAASGASVTLSNILVVFFLVEF